MRWSKEKGWQHLKDELDGVDAYLDKTFFKEGLQKDN
jgi:hypothetical protein